MNVFSKGNDLLFLNITLHICGQVKILRLRFMNFDVTSPQIYDRFNALIQRHCYLIMLARELTDLISFVLLIELFIISVLICIMGDYYDIYDCSAKHVNYIFVKKIYIQLTNILFRISGHPRIESQWYRYDGKEFNNTKCFPGTTNVI